MLYMVRDTGEMSSDVEAIVNDYGNHPVVVADSRRCCGFPPLLRIPAVVADLKSATHESGISNPLQLRFQIPSN
jgi:hypothetical protein